MMMTHYMELLSLDQPWNLIFYMVIPVGLAELLVATEFFTMYNIDDKNSAVRKVNRLIGIVLGFYFTALVIYFMINIYPGIKWRGSADVIAVTSYLLGVFPLLSIALLEIGVIGKNLADRAKLKLHFCLLITFLVVGHVAMIFGMVDPTITGWKPSQGEMMHMGHEMNMQMPNMDRSGMDMPDHDENKTHVMDHSGHDMQGVGGHDRSKMSH
ncbi:DUF6803 family protein [Campylobacter curvus]|uniref:Membrane protein n=1 Tax=Campylobacter curvus (strain 525.92) TaxID=360105 RepID=A7GX38_CAMC5|nr:DUF6803 family protein [Campylobacter curvus]EAT99862.1 putative membrane protein [Campylobacter curvus 525.92]